MTDFGKVKIFAGRATENVKHVQTGGFEVSGRVVGFADEDLRLGAAVRWLEVVRNLLKKKNG